MDRRPDVRVIFQDAPQPSPGLGAVLLELVTFLLLAGGVALLAGGGCLFLR